jgi:hypothetical protein
MQSSESTQQSTTPPHDISRRTIVILLILVTLLSALSTLSVLNEINKVKLMPTQNNQVATGKVQLTILDPNAPQTQPPNIATGKVVLEIKDR